jgi:hypothetical protein
MNTRKESPEGWWLLIIPALGRLRQEDLKFKVSLVYTMGHCLKKNEKKSN